ncbi:ATP-dependent DNA helicase [Trichonephila inaurata madagascariensis]|uniref:ATP-dependent DNA helicase n=1 Tax=Trichonephila inaurata madagascariensis TaxID=2747483 RepID=A0A8X6YS91_9ARAC|nr:ATP-dependent DNA helicase [Trichonephila inaurata madagascariensis]
MCCSSGKVKLSPILKPPEPLCSLLKGETAQLKDFVKHIRLFNNMFAMTSFKSNVALNNGWTSTFKVQSQVYHHAGLLHPANAEDRKYLQIYFLGEDEQVQKRLNLLDSPVDRTIVLKLQRMLHQHNSYVRSFKMAADVMDDNTQMDYKIKISGKAPLKERKGRFNAPIFKTQDGDILEIKQCSTYTEASQVLGLVEDDSHWYQAMEEAAVSQSPAQLRNLFAILIAVCGLNKPITLWENHKEDMTEDFLHQAGRNNPTENIEYCDALLNNTLLLGR